MEMKLPWILLKEFDSNNIKKGRGAISFANHSALYECMRVVLVNNTVTYLNLFVGPFK